jgi:hypothetical protein
LNVYKRDERKMKKKKTMFEYEKQKIKIFKLNDEIKKKSIKKQE